MHTFNETMEDSRVFATYCMAVTMIGQSAQILAERGADPQAMNFITTGIDLLAKQLRDYSESCGRVNVAERELAEVQQSFNRDRANQAY